MRRKEGEEAEEEEEEEGEERRVNGIESDRIALYVLLHSTVP